MDRSFCVTAETAIFKNAQTHRKDTKTQIALMLEKLESRNNQRPVGRQTFLIF